MKETRSNTASLSVDRDYRLEVDDMKAKAHVLIEGDVQGVGFRASAWRVAQKLGVVGWVRNVVDGRVEAIIEGERDRVKEMVEWCKRGPPGSQVTNTRIEWLPYNGEFETFEVERTGSINR